jgi:hypothetical protein
MLVVNSQNLQSGCHRSMRPARENFRIPTRVFILKSAQSTAISQDVRTTVQQASNAVASALIAIF